jgi:nitrogen regulatory protein PII
MRALAELDQRIQELQHALSDARAQYAAESDRMIEHARVTGIDQSSMCVGHHTARVVTKNTFTPLSFTYLSKVLREIVSNDAHVDTIIDALKDRREQKTSSRIQFS